MTRQAAVDMGLALATVEQAFVVYRLISWPADVYGLMPRERLLPIEAQTFEVFGGPVRRVDPQGELFGRSWP